MEIPRSSVPKKKPRLTLLPLEQSTGTVPAGSLIVSDVFAASESHGVDVAKAAWSVGFQGSIYYQQAVSEPLPPLVEHQNAVAELNKPDLPTDSVRSALQRFVVGPPRHMLLSATDEINRAAQSQARQCVLNLSSGTSKAQVTSLLYQHASGGSFASNLARFFQLDQAKLAQQEPRELARLQQSLIDFVDTAWNREPTISELKKSFCEAVQSFENGRNSVVIAAGNEGLIEAALEMQSHFDLQVPADFEQNILESPDATHVGATIILDGVEAPARYSSSWPGVEFYTSGDESPGVEFDDSKGLGKSGSSLASPRVGSLMAEIHRLHPEFSSLKVEQALSEQIAAEPSRMLGTGTIQRFLLNDESR